MNGKKFRALAIISLIFLLTNTYLVSAQKYQLVIITAYGRDLVDDTVNGVLSFTVVENQDQGSGVVIDIDRDGTNDILEEFSPGDSIRVDYDPNYLVVYKYIIPDPSNSTLFTIIWEGEADSVTKNLVEIPEFSPILIAPLFMATTLLALIYRRKHKR